MPTDPDRRAALRFTAAFATAADFHGPDGPRLAAAYAVLARLFAALPRLAEAVAGLGAELGHPAGAADLLGELARVLPVPHAVADAVRARLAAG